MYKKARLVVDGEDNVFVKRSPSFLSLLSSFRFQTFKSIQKPNPRNQTSNFKKQLSPNPLQKNTHSVLNLVAFSMFASSFCFVFASFYNLGGWMFGLLLLLVVVALLLRCGFVVVFLLFFDGHAPFGLLFDSLIFVKRKFGQHLEGSCLFTRRKKRNHDQTSDRAIFSWDHLLFRSDESSAIVSGATDSTTTLSTTKCVALWFFQPQFNLD